MSFKRLMATLLMAALPFAVAHAQFRDLDITVTINQDGSAKVVQVWDVSVYDGTEMYIPVENLGKMDLTDFWVSENGNEFANEGNRWDVDRSLERKAKRCGIVDKGGRSYELCWGKGSYGDHVWTLGYTLTGLVQSLNDYDAFNFRFVNPGMDPLPEHVKITFRNATGTPWTEETTKFWGFGLNGDIWMDELSNPSNPEIILESSESFRSNSNVTVMMRFDKGLYSPTVSRDMEFADMEKKAFKKSDYGEDRAINIISMIMVLLPFIIMLFSALWVVYCKATGNVYKKSIFGKTKITGWWRDVPFDGYLPASYFVLSKGGRISNKDLSSNVIGAYFLKWIMEGVLRAEANPDKLKDTNLVIVPGKATSFTDEVENKLFNMVIEASGDNMILEPKEFERWSRKNYKGVAAWPSKVLSSGASYLIGHKVIRNSSGASYPQSQAELCHVIEFKNFLNDFTLSKERTAVEVGLWKNYLVFAQLLGIADKVAKQFAELYPADFQEFTESFGTNPTIFVNSINRTNLVSRSSFSYAQSRTQAQQIRTSGGGGRTSFGGGGGFSGGGFGGGSR